MSRWLESKTFFWIASTFVAALTMLGGIVSFSYSYVYPKDSGAQLENRVSRIEQRIEKRLDRIEEKLDKLLNK